MKRGGSVWERYRTSSGVMRELSEEELREMPALDLVAEAEATGITIAAEGGQLRVRGPRNAEALGQVLLERKAEVLAALCRRGHRMLNEAPGLAPSAAYGTFPIADTVGWDADRAAAIVAEADALIDDALKTVPIAVNPARRNVLVNERAIVRRLARERDPFLAVWPQALLDLLQRWTKWDEGSGKR